MVTKLSGRVTSVSFLQDSKVESGSFDKSQRRIARSSSGQLANTAISIEVTLAGIVMLFSFEHPSNASFPILLILSGIVISSKAVHLANIDELRTVKFSFSEILIWVRPEQ